MLSNQEKFAAPQIRQEDRDKTIFFFAEAAENYALSIGLTQNTIHYELEFRRYMNELGIEGYRNLKDKEKKYLKLANEVLKSLDNDGIPLNTENWYSSYKNRMLQSGLPLYRKPYKLLPKQLTKF